jgi:hypothetical protein
LVGIGVNHIDIAEVVLVKGAFVVLIAVLTAWATSVVSKRMPDGKLKTNLLIIRTPEYAFLCVLALYCVAAGLFFYFAT